MTATVFKSDARIRQDLLDELERHRHFTPAEIGVEVDAGIVTLVGTVSSYAKLLAAADIAASIAGVRGVANELVVRAPSVGAPCDTDLAAAVSGALRLDPDVNEELIEVIVRGGIATLRGSVKTGYQRETAVNTARRIAGIVNVADEITVIPPTRDDGQIESEIRCALRRTIPLVAERIHVAAKAGIVTLKGNVQFFGDRLQAEKSAWMTTGVRNVVNMLTTTW